MGSIRRLNQARACLWKGDVDATMALFEDCKRKQAANFCAYLRKHRHRIVNYNYYHEQICKGWFGCG